MRPIVDRYDCEFKFDDINLPCDELPVRLRDEDCIRDGNCDIRYFTTHSYYKPWNATKGYEHNEWTAYDCDPVPDPAEAELSMPDGSWEKSVVTYAGVCFASWEGVVIKYATGDVVVPKDVESEVPKGGRVVY
ncbi:hypothetical protein DL766_009180 [Monosporascus sp. MC13-8B]|uniref:Uncharacterized protein n=1 Tax=Monosporascus cannonballus TaxID=155416 RepID=A0ABY0H232_9PEZI|nr:hypothetical protein DL762_006797 [Monosporascus cannonballus]RYO83060.1 hypothetical protein DL763_008009 [Monosporascus cannonballus]RYP16242.1 hypothetical protein DL766_009180 [Monosporascus sp. MC13-8B]